MFGLQHEVRVLAVDDDVLFDRMSFRSWLRFDGVSRLTFELLPPRFRQRFGQFFEIGQGVVAEIERHAAVSPAVEMLRLTERRVAAEDDCSEAALPQIVGHAVAFGGRSVFAGLVARPIDDPQRLTGFRQ